MGLLIEYLVRDFNVSTDTAATLIITMFVFGCGLVAQLVYMFIKNILARTLKRKIVFNMLKKILSDSKKMILSFNKHIVKFNNANGNYFEIDVVPIQFLDEIKKIDVFEFSNSFFVGIENLDRRQINDIDKKFNKVFVHLNTLYFINSRYLDEFMKFQENYRQYGDEWNNEVQSLTKSYRELTLNFDSYNDDEKSFIIEFNKIYTNWIKQENPDDCYRVNENLIEPSIKLLENTDYFKVPNMDKITNNLANCKVVILGKISLIESRKKTLKNYERRLRHSYWALSKLVKIFDPEFSIISRKKNKT
jgi:hypothetical protein